MSEQGVMLHEGRAATKWRRPVTARELVEWTYAVQQAHKGGGVHSGAAGISQTGLVIERLLIGCPIDSSLGGACHWGQTHCDGDALAVHGLVEEMPQRARWLLIHYGTLRSVPDWRPSVMPLRCVAVPGRKGQPRGIYEGSGRKHVADEVTYEGDYPTRELARVARAAWPGGPSLRCADDVVQYCRDEYREWRTALVALKINLRGCDLTGWRVVDVGAKHEPWNIL